MAAPAFSEGLIARLVYVRRYYSQLQDDNAVIEHYPAYYAGHLLENMFLWFPTDSWRRQSHFTKAVNAFLIFALVFLWAAILVGVLLHYREVELFAATQSVAISIGGLLNFLSLTQMFYNRELLTRVLLIVDQKLLAVPAQHRSLLRNSSLWQFKVALVLLAIGVSQGPPLLLFMVVTGDLYYQSYLLDSNESYSALWWLGALYQSWNVTYSAINYLLKEFVWVSLYYNISTLVQLQADKAAHLWEDEHCDRKKELSKLFGIIREVAELKKTLVDLSNFTNAYLFTWRAAIYIMLVLSGVAFLVMKQTMNTFVAFALCSMFPLYVLTISATWIYVGDRITHAFEEVDVALYCCNWVAASPKERKYVAIYKAMLAEKVYISAGPFSVMDWETFGNIIKKCYYFLTLIMDYVNA